MRDTLTPEASATHWMAERRLAVTMVVLTLALVAAAVLVPPWLGEIAVLGLPLGYFLAAIGVPLVLMVLAGLFSVRQAAVDETYDAAEE